MTVSQLLERVRDNSPDLQAARQGVAYAEGERTSARAYPNPEFSFGAGPWRSRVGGGAGSAQEFGVSQPIALPSVRTARLGAGEAGVDVARAQADALRLQVGYQAMQAFYELRRREEEERLARGDVELIEQIRDRVLKRVAVGEAPRFELVRAEAEALAGQNALATASLRVEEARAVLRRIAANVLPERFRTSGPEPAIEALPPLAALEQELLATHPGLRALAAERDRAERRLELERALRAPQPALRYGESRDPETRAAVLGVTLSLPLWDRREGQIAQASAAVSLASSAIERERLQLLREMESAHARFSITNRQISTFEAGLLRGAEAALQAAEAAYRFGERSFLEVLDAQRTLRGVRGDYNRARHDRVAAWLDLERLRSRDPFALEVKP